jgi:uncharacterized alkaline shock family protein YloU
MNAFNRVVMIILLLVLIVIAAVVAVFPREAFDTLAAIFDYLAGEVSFYWESDWAAWAFFFAIRALIGGGIIILALFVLWLEIRRPRQKTIRVQKVAGGEARIATESIVRRLAYNVDKLPDVIKVTPKLNATSRGVDVRLFLETTPEIDVPMKTEEVCEVAREVVEEQLGLRLNKVQVNVKHAAFPRGTE